MNASRIGFCIALAAACLRADVLEDIARSVPGTARRASSGLFDPESNNDAYHIGPGETQVLCELEGPGEIRHMWFTLASRDRRFNRTVVLRMYWDGTSVPSVESPIGDFFAAGNGMRAELNSLPVQVTSYGRALNCYWRMPFRTRARIEVANEGKHDLCIYWQFDWMQLPAPPPDMCYFHARYRQEFPAKPFAPYVIFDGKGAGHYVGTVFSLQSSFASWFGESDDRFYIDGEEEPSIVGTGTEDYFNDAWNLRLFSNANTGVTIKEPNAEDCRFTAYRWHIQAPVTFTRSLRVDIERRSYALVVDPETGAKTTYDFKFRPDFCSSVAFWYQKDIAVPSEPFPPAAARVNKEVFVEAAGEDQRLRASPGVKAATRSNRVANQKRALHVESDGPGGWLEIPFRIEEAGKYSISVYQILTLAGGVWKVGLRGPAGDIALDDAMSFHDIFVTRRENYPESFLYGTWWEKKVGIHALEPGKYVVRFESAGAATCDLDGISIRRFPWDDLHGWMQRYLAEEAALFAARIAEARTAVAALAARIEGYRRATGAYPRALEDLGAVARDPWGQSYRYEAPGRFLPAAFDVYSVHGNSRAPGGWIGNWPSPYVMPGACEGEALQVAAADAGVAPVVQALDINAAPPLSGGKLLFVPFREEGARVDLELPPQAPGRYRLDARLVTSRDYGILALSLDGRRLASAIDAFTPKLGIKTVPCGEVELRDVPSVLRLEAAGRNDASQGYRAGLDAIVLTPVKR